MLLNFCASILPQELLRLPTAEPSAPGTQQWQGYYTDNHIYGRVEVSVLPAPGTLAIIIMEEWQHLTYLIPGTSKCVISLRCSCPFPMIDNWLLKDRGLL